MSKFRRHAKPWNWRGEPIVEPRGYVLVHVGKDHPLADCRGYAYQHRLVAAEKTGELPIGKHVHHDNQNKSDNSPGNLEPLTVQEHRYRHRKPGCRLRLPNEDNPKISCACGCGATFLKYDRAGRYRQYIPGHNPIDAPTKNAIVALLEVSPIPLGLSELSLGVRTTMAAIKAALSDLKREGSAVRIERGKWSTKPHEPTKINELISCACGCGGIFSKFDVHWRPRRFIHGHYNRGPK